MSHYVHFLTRHWASPGAEWVTIAELESDSYSGCGFVIPVRDDGGLFDDYLIGVHFTREPGIVRYLPLVHEAGGLRLSVNGRIVDFECSRSGTGHYCGNQYHEDFEHPLMEILELDNALDGLFDEGAVVVGCASLLMYQDKIV